MIQTNLARCRDCYSCVRACSVKAVRVHEAQAQVVQELCLVCGTCVRACPQGAKQVREDRPLVERALAEGRRVYASVAPSAPAFFNLTSFTTMAEALQGLGFAGASETALGAEMVGRAYGELLLPSHARRPAIATACPVVVNLVEMYYPDLIPNLAPIVSPMIAHARLLRQRLGQDAFIVFVGPCVAKKAEMLDEAVRGVVDAALTFGELKSWLYDSAIRLGGMEVQQEATERPPARLFPLEGGLIGTAHLPTDMLGDHSVVASGLDACRDVLEGIRAGGIEAAIAELMACRGGCINGPAMDAGTSVAVYRQRLLDYAANRQPEALPEREEWPDLSRTFRDRSRPVPQFSDEEIKAALAQVEKYTPEDELNCGACGYASCREKAVAALRGMAELTMCIPYMRSRAESLTNVVMDSVPNAVLVVDEQLHIQDLSASALRMFSCHRADCLGKPLRELVPVVAPFLDVQQTGETVSALKTAIRDNLIVELTIVPVRGKGLMVSVMRDITEQEKARASLAHLRSETLERTQAVIKKQMRVAHEIAGLLGETTAETKVLLSELRRLMQEDSGSETTG
ncbi:MAG: [Fe-Fe] hydrogenase large subunit C-terminal domain-containing protein [Anaerolineae bacterium]